MSTDDQRVEKFARQTNWVLIGVGLAMAVLAATCTIALTTSHSQIKKIRETAAISKRTAAVSKTTADRLADVVRDIQSQRRNNIFNNCIDQNIRHDRTVDRLRDEAHRRGIPLTRLAPTIGLISALAPVRDCAALVAEQTKATP
jgi:hypothetical protein